MRQPRGLSGSATHLIAPPFPAASRPSNSITTFLPVALIQYCIFTNSMCSSSNLASYSLRFSLHSCGDWLTTSFAALFPFLPTIVSSLLESPIPWTLRTVRRHLIRLERWRTLFSLRGGKQTKRAKQLLFPHAMFFAKSDEVRKQRWLGSRFRKKIHEP